MLRGAVLPVLLALGGLACGDVQPVGGEFTTAQSDATTGDAGDVGSGGAAEATSLSGEAGDESTGGHQSDACDVYQQDCPPTQKCVPYSGDGDGTWNDLRCSALDSAPKQLGEGCRAPDGGVGGADDCDVGLMCWNVRPGETEGVCAALCAGSSTAGVCPPGTFCSVYNDGILPICLETCDPLGLGCPSGELCIPQGGSGGRFVCAVDAAPNSGSFGDPCLAFNKCNPGLFCAPASAVPGCNETLGCCSNYCDLAEDNPDASCEGVGLGQICVPFYESGAAPGFESVGGCANP